MTLPSEMKIYRVKEASTEDVQKQSLNYGNRVIPCSTKLAIKKFKNTANNSNDRATFTGVKETQAVTSR